MRKLFLILIALVAFSSSANAEISAYYSRMITIMIDSNGPSIMVLVGSKLRSNQYEIYSMNTRQEDSGYCYIWAGDLKSKEVYTTTMIGELCSADGAEVIIYTEKTFNNGKVIKTTTTKMKAAD